MYQYFIKVKNTHMAKLVNFSAYFVVSLKAKEHAIVIVCMQL